MTDSAGKDLTAGKPLKLILGFAVPMLLGYLFQQFYNMVDTIVVGKCLGVSALASVGSTSSINFMINGFCIGVCSGFSIPVAQRFGAGDGRGLRRFAANAAWLALIFSVVMTVLVGVLCMDILRWMDTPEDIESLAQALETIDAESMASDTVSEAYRNLYDKLLELAGPQISEACQESGNAAYRDGDYDTAVAELERAFSYDETNSDALLLLGDAYRRNGDSRNATRIYEQVMELFPNTENARRAENALEELEG